MSKPEAIKKITNAFPEIKKDLVAHTILSEPILLASLQKMESLQKLNQHHPCLIAAADLILKTIVELAAIPKLTSPQADDDLSDSSSSSSDGGGGGGSSSTRAITRDQLTAALLYVSSNSLNSLANLSERQVNNETTATSSGVAAETSPSDPAPSTSGLQNVRITSSMFSNALSQALSSTSTATAGNEATTPATVAAEIVPNITQTTTMTVPPTTTEQPPTVPTNEMQTNENVYTTELQQMLEMGMLDEALNLQALFLCNGNVDAAINLIFSGAIA